MKLETGRPFYGQHIGVLVFSTQTSRIPGDPGCSTSFRYPVRYEVVQGGFADLIDGSEKICSALTQAGERLKAVGVRAILGDCGLMSLYQDVLGARWGLPFVGSALCQLPLVWQLCGRAGQIGILTGHAGLLGEAHLRASGWTEEIALSVQGLEDEPHFYEVVIHGGLSLNPRLMRQDLLRAGEKLRAKTPHLRAVVVECSNLPTYSAALSQSLGVPVFDILSAANLLEYSVNPPRYPCPGDLLEE